MVNHHLVHEFTQTSTRRAPHYPNIHGVSLTSTRRAPHYPNIHGVSLTSTRRAPHYPNIHGVSLTSTRRAPHYLTAHTRPQHQPTSPADLCVAVTHSCTWRPRDHYPDAKRVHTCRRPCPRFCRQFVEHQVVGANLCEAQRESVCVFMYAFMYAYIAPSCGGNFTHIHSCMARIGIGLWR